MHSLFRLLFHPKKPYLVYGQITSVHHSPRQAFFFPNQLNAFMQVHQFESLNINSQVCLAWKKGVHIGYRSEGKYYMSLYRLENFYVEVHYHTCYDGVACIKVLACEEQLQAYLQQIDLSEILTTS